MKASNPQMKRGNIFMNARPGLIGRIFCLICVSMFFQVKSFAATLDDISYSSLPGDKVELDLTLSEPPQGEPLNFTIDNPARIVLDFPDTTLNLKQKNIPIGIGVAHSVSAVEAAGRTRVVLNLDSSVGYDMAVDGNTVKVTLAGGVSGTAATAMAGKQMSMAGAAKSSIENIDFRRGDKGEGRILVTLSDPSASVNLGKEGGKVIVDFLNTSLPADLNRRLDVVDFATPVKEIDTSPSANGTRMVISTTTEDYDHLAYQSDNQLTIEFKPLSKAEKEEVQKQKFGYTGERLSLNFQDIEVRAVLQLIADFTGLNMVASDTVHGNVRESIESGTFHLSVCTI